MRNTASLLRLRGVWRVTMRDAGSGRIISRRRYSNVACVNGKSFIASWLNLEAPAHNSSNIYGAVGTSATAPAATDTQLGAELARVLLGANSRLTNVVTMDFFYNTSQGNGAWTEAGLFLGANSAANSGSLLSHVTVSENKTTLVTATLEFTIQIG